MRWTRMVLLAALALLSIGLIAVAGALWVANTKAGRDLIVAELNRAMAGVARLDGLSGRVPDAIRLDRLRLIDESGAWLEARDLELDLAPLAIIRRTVWVDRLAAATIEVHRAPLPGETGPATDEPFAIQPPPVAVIVEDLSLPEIRLAPAVLGAPARLALAGRARLPSAGRDIVLEADLRRLDVPASGTLTLLHDAVAGRLKLAIKASEPPDGLVARILDLPGRPAVEVNIEGSGPLDDFAATAYVRAGEIARIDGELRMTATGAGRRLRLDAKAGLAGALPPQFAEIVGPAVTATADLLVPRDGPIEVGRLVIQADDLKVTADGQIASAAETIELSVGADGAIGPLAGLAELPGAGRFIMTAEIAGAWRRPSASVTVQLTEPAIGPVSADTIELTTQVRLAAETEIAAAGTAIVQALAISGAPPPFVGNMVDLKFDLTVDPDAGVLAIRLIQATAKPTTIEIAGRISAAGRLDLDLSATVDDLTGAAGLAGLAGLDGRAALRAEVSGSIDQDMAVAGQGRLTGFRSGLPIADALLGSAPEVQAAGTLSADRGLTLERYSLHGAAAAIDGSGRLTGDFDRLDTDLTFALTDAGALAPVLGLPLQGPVAGAAKVTGPVNAIKLDAIAEWSEPTIGPLALDRLSANLALDTLTPTPRGTVRIDGSRGTTDLTVVSGFALAGDRLSLTDLAADGTALRLASRRLTVDLADAVMVGAFTGEIADLAPWAALAGEDLAGRVALSLDLDRVDGAQNISAEASGADLVVPAAGLRLQAAQLTLRLADPWARPTGQAQAAAAGLTVADTRIAAIGIGAALARERADFHLKVDGPATVRASTLDLAVEARGGVGWPGDERMLALDSFAATIAGTKLVLRAPVTVRHGPRQSRIEGLDLTIGDGRLAGSLGLDGEHLTGAMTATDVPLRDLTSVLAGRPVASRLNATLELGGRSTAPSATLAARLDGIVVDADLDEMLSELYLEATARLNDGRIAFDGALGGVPGAKAAFAGELPVHVDLTAGTLGLVKTEPVHARLTLAGDLATLEQVLPLGGDRLAGAVGAEIRASGSLEAIELSGDGGLSDGVYESAVTGAVIRDIGFRLRGAGNRIVLEDLTGNDGETGKQQGRLQGAGSLTVDQDLAAELDLRLGFTKFAVARLDMVRATASGDLTLTGAADDLSLRGDLRVDQADIQIPQRLPASITTLEVREINGPATPAEAKPKPDGSAGKIALDLTVDIPGRVFVRGRGLDSEWRGRFEVGGTTAAPQVTGNLDVVRGQFALAGKTFALKRGRIELAPDRRGETVPEVDLLASTAVTELTAEVAVTGPLDDPAITLASTPLLPQDEILARILFGTNVGALSPVQALQLAQAGLEISGRLGTGSILGDIRRSVGLDFLDVGAGDSLGGGGLSGTALRAGKYLREDVYVGVNQGLTPESSSVVVEYKVLPNISVESSVGAAARGDIGVTYERRY